MLETGCRYYIEVKNNRIDLTEKAKVLKSFVGFPILIRRSGNSFGDHGILEKVNSDDYTYYEDE